MPEGWHRGIQSNISAYHPNLWYFLVIFRGEQALKKRLSNSDLETTSRFPPVVDRVKCKEKENKYRFIRR